MVDPIATQLRTIREHVGLSLADVGELSNGRFPASVVGSYERGTRQPPLAKLRALLVFYGYTLRVEALGGES